MTLNLSINKKYKWETSYLLAKISEVVLKVMKAECTLNAKKVVVMTRSIVEKAKDLSVFLELAMEFIIIHLGVAMRKKNDLL